MVSNSFFKENIEQDNFAFCQKLLIISFLLEIQVIVPRPPNPTIPEVVIIDDAESSG